jgi:glucose dehydrogenase
VIRPNLKALGTALALTVLALAGAALAARDSAPAAVDAARLLHPAAGEWLSDGRTYDAQRFSPLGQINEKTVGQLGLAWYADLDTYRGVEGTPLYVDGVLYNISAWDVVTAYDARSGKAHPRRAADLAGRAQRQAQLDHRDLRQVPALFHYRRAACVRRQGGDRQWRRRPRRPGLRGRLQR